MSETAPEMPTATPNATPPTPADIAPKQPDPEPQATPEAEPELDDITTDAGIEAVRKVRNEAKNLRIRLRDTEAERDTITGQLDELRRQVVESVLEQVAPTVSPKAFWADGRTLDGLLAESGRVDVESVATAAAEAAEAFGLTRTPAPNPAQGSSAAGPSAPPRAFADAFKSKAVR